MHQEHRGCGTGGQRRYQNPDLSIASDTPKCPGPLTDEKAKGSPVKLSAASQLRGVSSAGFYTQTTVWAASSALCLDAFLGAEFSIDRVSRPGHLLPTPACAPPRPTSCRHAVHLASPTFACGSEVPLAAAASGPPQSRAQVLRKTCGP